MHLSQDSNVNAMENICHHSRFTLGFFPLSELSMKLLIIKFWCLKMIYFPVSAYILCWCDKQVHTTYVHIYARTCMHAHTRTHTHTNALVEYWSYSSFDDGQPVRKQSKSCPLKFFGPWGVRFFRTNFLWEWCLSPLPHFITFPNPLWSRVLIANSWLMGEGSLHHTSI